MWVGSVVGGMPSRRLARWKTSGITSRVGPNASWYSAHPPPRAARAGSCTASIGARPHSVGASTEKRSSASSVALIASARPPCSYGGCIPERSISTWGS